MDGTQESPLEGWDYIGGGGWVVQSKTLVSNSELHRAFSQKSQTYWKFVYINSIKQCRPQTISTGPLLQMIVESVYGVARRALRTQHIALHDQIPCIQ